MHQSPFRDDWWNLVQYYSVHFTVFRLQSFMVEVCRPCQSLVVPAGMTNGYHSPSAAASRRTLLYFLFKLRRFYAYREDICIKGSRSATYTHQIGITSCEDYDYKSLKIFGIGTTVYREAHLLHITRVVCSMYYILCSVLFIYWNSFDYSCIAFLIKLLYNVVHVTTFAQWLASRPSHSIGGGPSCGNKILGNGNKRLN